MEMEEKGYTLDELIEKDKGMKRGSRGGKRGDFRGGNRGSFKRGGDGFKDKSHGFSSYRDRDDGGFR